MRSLLGRTLGRLPIGWMQLMHNRTRLLAAVGGVTFANVLIFMQLGFMNALFETSVFTHREFGTDIFIVSSDFRALREANPLPRARMYQALAVEGVEKATPVYIGTNYWTDATTGDTTNFRIIGVDPSATVFANAQLTETSFLLTQPDTAIVDRRTRGFRSEIAAVIETEGEYEVEINGRRVRFTSMFEQGASFDVDGSLVVSDQTFFRLFPRRTPAAPTIILVKTGDNDDPEMVARRINAAMPENDVRAYSKAGLINVEQSYQATQTPIGFVFGFGVAIGLVVGLVIVYQVLATDVQDHLSEYATFKAIGYAPRFFLGIIFEEALSLATLGFLPGLAISLFLYQVAAIKTGLPIAMPWSRPLFVFALTTLMCTVSGAIATKRLNSADPAELF